MTDRPLVTIVLLTYEDGQRNTAEITLRSTLDHLHYSGPLAVHIADDGSIEGHVEALRMLAGGYPHLVTVGSTNVERRGYGASWNAATQSVHLSSPIVMPIEDDWELRRDLDLGPLVDTLLASSSPVQCIRLGYIGFTQSLRSLFIDTPAGIMALLDPLSPERHVAAGHPRIETREWERAIGPWTEGLAAGATEFEWCGRRSARLGVAWPLDVVRPSEHLFAHIGAHGLGELIPEGRSDA